MNLELQRFASREHTTLGALFDVSTSTRRFLCFVLEDEFRAVKAPGTARILAGTYQVRLRKDGSFHERYARRFQATHKGMLRLESAELTRMIVIHCGSTAEITDGCLHVGDDAHFDPEGGDSWIGSSTAAYQRIYPEIAAAAEAGECSLVVEGFA